jgi:hypothetical protein
VVVLFFLVNIPKGLYVYRNELSAFHSTPSGRTNSSISIL